MITINEISIDEVKYLTGTIGKASYSVPFSTETRATLLGLQSEVALTETVEEYNKLLANALDIVAQLTGSDNELEESLVEDVYYNSKQGTYHIKVDGKMGTDSIPKFFVNKMIEAVEKGLPAKPWLIFWVRLMRNPLYKGNQSKIDRAIEYLGAPYTDEKHKETLMKDNGYAEAVAHKLATFDQINITEQGILAAFKYVSLVNEKFVVEKDEDGGNQHIIKKVPKYERVLEVDEETGEVIKDELGLPTIAEEFLFLPPVMGTSGDAFTSHLIADAGKDNKKGHHIRVGRIHELAEGFSQVNTSDNSSCVKGLHVGGRNYVESFGGKTAYLVDCLIAPEDIGAITGIYDGGDSAIRCRRYMVTGAHFAVNKGMYHPSKFATLLDSEWIEAKLAAIEGITKAIDDLEAQL